MNKMFDQYRTDFFNKLDFDFEKGRKILDIGCGDVKDDEVFIKKFKLVTYGVDVYTNPEITNVKGLKFIEDKNGVLKLPFKDNTFDYVYMHDVLHHVDEKNQSYEKHLLGLKEAKRVVKPGGSVIVVEGNRFNPLFYPHMVLMLGHQHFTQKYFKKIIRGVFDDVEFKFFECHFYPEKLLPIFYLYERFMETFSPEALLAYNVAVARK